MGRQQGRSYGGRGRSGRSGARGRGGSNKNKRESGRKDAGNQQFLVGTAKQASDFIKIKKQCINSFKIKYKQGIYLATAMENGTDYDFSSEKPDPLVLISEAGPEPEKILAAQGTNESNKIEYKMKMEKYNEKLETYAENKFKAYGFLWEKCSSQMKQNIEAKTNFNTSIKNNPFQLLKVIEGLSYNYQESKYEIAIILDAIKTFINLKQKEDENLTSYLE